MSVSKALRTPRFRLYLITDRHLAAPRGGLLAVLEAALGAAVEVAGPGAVAVQLREKDLAAREMYDLACAVRHRCARVGAPLLINDRIDIALAAGADGVHLPADSFALTDARRMLAHSSLIGVSTHHREEVAEAAAAGADFAVFGPVYQPLSKAAYGPAVGLASLRAATKAARAMPIYALGGITAARIGEITMEPALCPFGVAVIGAVFAAADPAAATRELLRALPRS